MSMIDPATPNGRVKIRVLSGNELGLHKCLMQGETVEEF